MVDRSSQSWLPTQALAFFVYATHASHATHLQLALMRAMRAFEWKPGLRKIAELSLTLPRFNETHCVYYLYLLLYVDILARDRDRATVGPAGPRLL